MAPLLQVRDLKTQFFTQDGVVHAVDGVSFELEPGETLGIVGESGCGKSVTAMSIMRLIPNPPGRITDGQVLFEGEDILKIPEDDMRAIRGNKIAMIFQDPMTSLNPVLTVNNQISESLILHMGMKKAEAKQRAIELLKLVGIPSPETRVDQYPHQFSGGMRQRVMIAMALSCNPTLLLADEPTTALDVTIQAQILDIIKRLCVERGTAVIMITHDLGVVAGITQRVHVMYAGHVVEKGTTRDVYAKPQHPYTIGLLKSIPRLDEGSKQKLTPIEGLPPDLVTPPNRCDFAPRCMFSVEQCWNERPTLRTVYGNHEVACWVDVETAATHVPGRKA